MGVFGTVTRTAEEHCCQRLIAIFGRRKLRVTNAVIKQLLRRWPNWGGRPWSSGNAKPETKNLWERDYLNFLDRRQNKIARKVFLIREISCNTIFEYPPEVRREVPGDSRPRGSGAGVRGRTGGQVPADSRGLFLREGGVM